MPEQHTPVEHDVSHYPHFQGDGEVTHAQLVDHMAEHPELYGHGLSDIAYSHLLKAGFAEHRQQETQPVVTDTMRRQAERVIDYLERGELKFDLAEADAQNLIDVGQSNYVAEHLKDFVFLSPSIARQLMEKGYRFAVAQSIGSFNDLPDDIIRDFIDNGYIDDVVDNLYCCKSLSTEVMHELEDKGFELEVLCNLKAFAELPDEYISRLIDQGHGDWIFVDFDENEQVMSRALRYALDTNQLDALHFIHEGFKFIDTYTPDETRRVIEAIGTGTIANTLQNAFHGLDRPTLMEVAKEQKDSYLMRALVAEMPAISGYLIDTLLELGDTYAIATVIDKIDIDDLLQLLEAKNMLEWSDEMSHLMHPIRRGETFDRLALKLVARKPELLDYVIYKYQGDFGELVGILEEAEAYDLIVKNAEIFIGLDNERLSHFFAKMIESDQPYDLTTVRQFMSRHRGTHDLGDEVRLALIAAEHSGIVLEYIGSFKPFDHSSFIMELVDSGDFDENSLNFIHFLSGLSSECLDKILTVVPESLIYQYLACFDGIDTQKYIDALFDDKDQLGMDTAELLVDQYIQRGNKEGFRIVLDKLLSAVNQQNGLIGINPGLANRAKELGLEISLEGSKDKIEAYIASGSYRRERFDLGWSYGEEEDDFMHYIEDDSYDATKFDIDSLEANIEGFLALYSLSTNTESDPLPEYVTLASDQATGNIDGAMLLQLRNLIQNGAMTQEMQLLGVTQAGIEGARYYSERLGQLNKEFMNVELTDTQEALLLHSEAARNAFLNATEINKSSGYGARNEKALLQKVRYMRQSRERGSIKPMSPEYTPSEIYEIKTTASSKEKPQWSEDVLSKYRSLRSEMRDAAKVATEFNGFGKLISDLRDDIRQVMEGIDHNLQAVDRSDPKAEFKRQHLMKRKDSLADYVQEVENGQQAHKSFIMNSPVDFQRGFQVLESFPELHSRMRTLTFAWAMRNNPYVIGEVGSASLPREDPSVENMAYIREFVDKIVNDHTYGDYFTDKKSAQKFRQMTSTKSLNDAIIRYNTQVAKPKTTGIQFIPTRGIYMEESGQIGDACWADQHPSIAEAMPNMTALIMKARPGAKNERIVGAALLIETVDEDTGEDVLVLRGNNPTENYINKVDVGDYYEAISDYVKQTATKKGMKAAVVIDGFSGGSATNRPVLFEYLANMRNTLEQTEVPENDTTFNGYVISNHTYTMS